MIGINSVNVRIALCCLTDWLSASQGLCSLHFLAQLTDCQLHKDCAPSTLLPSWLTVSFTRRTVLLALCCPADWLSASQEGLCSVHFVAQLTDCQLHKKECAPCTLLPSWLTVSFTRRTVLRAHFAQLTDYQFHKKECAPCTLLLMDMVSIFSFFNSHDRLFIEGQNKETPLYFL
jgi:hypothetical protein